MRYPKAVVIDCDLGRPDIQCQTELTWINNELEFLPSEVVVDITKLEHDLILLARHFTTGYITVISIANHCNMIMPLVYVYTLNDLTVWKATPL